MLLFSHGVEKGIQSQAQPHHDPLLWGILRNISAFPLGWRAAGAGMAVMELSVVPRDGSQGWFCPHGDTLTLLISTGALLALQSTQEEGGDVSHCGHEAGEELLPALHQLCSLHGDGHVRHLEQAPAQGCDGSCRTPTSAHCGVSTALPLLPEPVADMAQEQESEQGPG